MVKKKYKDRYTGVSIPQDIMGQVEKFRKEHPEQKYRSRAEFIVEAIRSKLESENLKLEPMKSFIDSQQNKQKEHELLLKTIIELQKEILDLKKKK